MFAIKNTGNRRAAFTLVELLVAVAIILALAALAAAFAPQISDSRNLTRAVDNLEQWLLTAKMRAKRDGLATGIRFIQAQGDQPGTFSQVQYIQQAPPLSGGPGMKGQIATVVGSTVTFANVDFSLGGLPQYDAYGQPQWLVQTGDYLAVNNGSAHLIVNVLPGNSVQLYDPSGASMNIPLGAFYQIFREPRVFIGETPLELPNNFAVDMTLGGNVQAGPTPSHYIKPPGPATYYDIVFSPSGAIVGANAANGITEFIVRDMTMTPYDPNRAGIVAVQTTTGFIGAYDVATGTNPFYFVQFGRESGL